MTQIDHLVNIVESGNYIQSEDAGESRVLMVTDKEKQYFRKQEDFTVSEIEQAAYLDDGRIFEFSIQMLWNAVYDA